MKERIRISGFPKFQQDSKSAASVSNTESPDIKTTLSDDELGQVSAAGDACVPTMNPEVLLGRHAIPDGAEERRPQ